MKKKLQNIINNSYAVITVVAVIAIWQAISSAGIVPTFLLPSPADVIKAFVGDFSLLVNHAAITLAEAAAGLVIGIVIGFAVAVLMDHFEKVYKALYPIIVITQTVPSIAIAPLLVLWMGYGMMPKITLIVIATFFPIAIGLLEGFKSVDKDTINLMKAMGADRVQIFRYVKFPASLGSFFASLKISVSYCIVGAVISEWLGGYGGLGVYMTRVRQSYAFDKMFAVIFLISALSLLMIWLVSVLQKKCMPWERKGE